MALVKAENLSAPLAGFNRLPMVRQLALMAGFAASIALAVSIVMWAKAPNYRMLYGSLSTQEVMDISQALDQAGIKYELDEMTGAIMVPGDQVHEARLKLAGLGLPKGSGVGYELLEKDQGFSTSQFMESARYQRALEGELARTIGSLNAIQTARVHLALPKQTGFVRDRKKPSASVVVTLYQGRTMNQDQVAAITHMVASSVPNLEIGDVTVVDQSGHLLSEPEMSDDMRYSSTQFDYRKKLEDYYIKRIETILSPIVGMEGVRAQVVADLDFTVTEQTQESYNPDLPSVRSEQTLEEDSVGSASTGGVPGTLSNQPPGGATTNTATATATGEQGTTPKNSTRRTVRNYELDRTISHSRLPSAVMKRLSAAVVVDEKRVTAEDGTVSTQPLSDEEMARINSLVKEAVGFNAQRGDSVNVINAAFQAMPEPEPLPEQGLLEKPWLWDVAKQLLGLLAVLALFFGVLKPVLKSLAEKGRMGAAGGAAMGAEGLADDTLSLAGPGGAPQLSAPQQQAHYEEQLAAAKAVATQDPRRVADMMRDWVERDG